MAQVEKPLREPPQDSSLKESLDEYLEDIRRKVNSQAGALADLTVRTTETAGAAYTSNEQLMLNHLKADVASIVNTINILLSELRSSGYVARS